MISDHLEAVKDHLVAGGIPCGRGRPPDGHGPTESWAGAPGQSAFAAYAFVSRIGAIDELSSTLDDTWNEARPLVNIQCVGATDEQAEDLLDLVRARMKDFRVLAGRNVLRCWLDVTETTFVDRDVTPHVHVTAARYRLWTEAA